jgi:hypothetical protein
MRTFIFNFEQLSFEDQKAVYKHLFSEYYGSEKFEAANSLDELKAIVDEMENEDVYPLAYMVGMLAHGVAYVFSVPFETEDGEKKEFVDIHFKEGYELGNDFDIEWFNGLNSDGKGMISLYETVAFYDLETLVPIFKKYPLVS